MGREKSYALYSEKGYILKIDVTNKGTEILIISDVKHSISKNNVCLVKISFGDLNIPVLAYTSFKLQSSFNTTF